jgi:hypothetical protein
MAVDDVATPTTTHTIEPPSVQLDQPSLREETGMSHYVVRERAVSEEDMTARTWGQDNHFVASQQILGRKGVDDYLLPPHRRQSCACIETDAHVFSNLLAPVGDWSIFRRFDVFCSKNVGRKHGPVPFHVRATSAHIAPLTHPFGGFLTMMTIVSRSCVQAADPNVGLLRGFPRER